MKKIKLIGTINQSLINQCFLQDLQLQLNKQSSGRMNIQLRNRLYDQLRGELCDQMSSKLYWQLNDQLQNIEV
jgi:hypothetical protein